jgi:GT2 family glycosyltransferase
MKIAVIFLTLGRTDLSIRTIQQNFYNGGYPADCILIDNGSNIKDFNLVFDSYKWHYADWSLEKRGIAKGVNIGLHLTKRYDAVCLMANDILMPNDWLKTMVEYSSKIENTGIIGIHCVESLPPLQDGIHRTHTPFGNNLIMRSVIDKIGGYNTEYDPYGMQDSDFGERSIIAGFTNYYLPNLRSEHIGHDIGENSDYRRAKDESLRNAQNIWNKYQKIYHEDKNIYLPL